MEKLKAWVRLKMHYIEGRPYIWLDDYLAIFFIVLGALGFIDNGPLPYIPVLTELYWGLRSEMVGIGITVLIIANANDWMNRRAEKDRVILQMGSPDNATAIEAVRQLSSRGWLFDGTLREANLSDADLSGANLCRADLSGRAELASAHLRGANLAWADLSRARLRWANMSEANLQFVNLHETILSEAEYTNGTAWPDGWDKEKRNKAGAINVDEQ